MKPVSKKQDVGFLQIGVELYGGGLWHTWFDRDLGLAGRVMVRGKDGAIRSTLVKIDKPVCRIPTLAIHLDRQEKFEFNKETQLLPIAGLVSAELNREQKRKHTASTDIAKPSKSVSGTALQTGLKSLNQRHHPYVVESVADAIEEDAAAIVDFELLLYDTQKACFGGLNDEFIYSARLDNLLMSYCTIKGLIKSLGSDGDSHESDDTIRLAALFDHEEIGSKTAQGADSNLLPAVIRRLCSINDQDANGKENRCDDGTEAYHRTLASSFLISADMAHSVHPNYSAKYEADHRPQMNEGTVIKVNANARYATNSPGIALLQETARSARPSSSLPRPESNAEVDGLPLQLFVVRNDSSCGSTIGPMLSAALGMRTLDLGNAQLSMHSIRETAGTWDVEHSINLFESFYKNYGTLRLKITVDETTG